MAEELRQGDETARSRAIDPLADAILERLRRFPEVRALVLGGYLALRQYADYRYTHDIDAWWATDVDTTTRNAALARVREVCVAVATENGLTVVERPFGEVVSLEFRQPPAGRTIFSVQIGDRSIELEPPLPSPWAPVRIEALADTIGAKMNALVARGAPRDFVDVREIVVRGLSTTAQMWELWDRKNPGRDRAAALAQVLHHLAALEARRPLDQVPLQELAAASRLREWARSDLVSEARSIPDRGPEPGS